METVLINLSMIHNRRKNIIDLLEIITQRDITINGTKYSIGYNCLNNYTLEKFIGKGGFGIVHSACLANNCNFIVKIQYTNNEAKMEIEVMKKLNEIPDYNGVRLIYNSECVDQLRHEKISIIVMDKWDGDIEKHPVAADKIDTFLDVISTQIKILHNLGYVHWDILPKNVLYKKPGQFSIADFGACRHENDKPYNAAFYDSYYFENTPYVDILSKDNLNINKNNIRGLLNEYKGIVDYFILYKYIYLKNKLTYSKEYSEKEISSLSKTYLIVLLEQDSHKGVDILKKHLENI